MTPLYASQVMLWLAVAGLAFLIAVLARQVGVLHERLVPVGALTGAQGPATGQPAPMVRATTLAGTVVELGVRREHGPLAGRATLLMFVARTCPICKVLIPVVLDMARRERLELVFVGDADRTEQEAMTREFAISPLQFVNGAEIGMAYAVDKLPHAALIDAQGLLVARGLVNSREHLESLVVAQETGFASVQSWLQGRKPAAA